MADDCDPDDYAVMQKWDAGREARELVEEGFGVLGAIDEVKAKCRLMASRLSLDEEVLDEILASLEQMDRDLAKYSRRLCEIHERLGELGALSIIS